nr:L-lactate dehydrogenase [cytochrome] [Candidatus Pantoea persica]
MLSLTPYGFNTRFEGAEGTKLGELTGAAHAACFSMALSLMLAISCKASILPPMSRWIKKAKISPLPKWC